MNNPRTIDECMQALTEMLKPEEQADILKMQKDDLGVMHMGLGMWIRNNWGLWQKREPNTLLDHMMSLGFIHPDDMSQTIIEEYWNRMNHQPSEIADKVKFYREYWEKHK